MKKYIMLSGLLFTMLILMVVGCDFDTNNTPTKQVELFLADYQTLNKDVMDNLHQVIIEDATFNEKQQEKGTRRYPNNISSCAFLKMNNRHPSSIIQLWRCIGPDGEGFL